MLGTCVESPAGSGLFGAIAAANLVLSRSRGLGTSHAKRAIRIRGTPSPTPMPIASDLVLLDGDDPDLSAVLDCSGEVKVEPEDGGFVVWDALELELLASVEVDSGLEVSWEVESLEVPVNLGVVKLDVLLVSCVDDGAVVGV